jgi:alkylated DNA nucleotide flippase Atl1
MARRPKRPSPVYAAVATLLDGEFWGTYGQLARRAGSHPRAVGAIVRKYGRLHPRWDPTHVVAARTGRPAFMA